MWSERIWFLSASVSAIGVCISVCVAKYINSLSTYNNVKNATDRSTQFLRISLIIICLSVCIFIILMVSYLLYTLYHAYRDHPSYVGDVTLAVLVGAAFGTFATRFVWALFGPSFGTT